MSSEAIAALSTIITALVSALAGAVVLVLNARTINRAKETSEKQNEYEKIIARYEKDLARREAHADNQQVVITKLQEANTVLRERVADINGRYKMVVDYAKRQYEFMRHKGITPELLPDEGRKLPESNDEETIDFNVRQVEQASNLLKKTRPSPTGKMAPPEEHDPSGVPEATEHKAPDDTTGTSPAQPEGGGT
jgi:hypothetical protein